MGCNECKKKQNRTEYQAPNGDTIIDDPSGDSVNLIPGELGNSLNNSFILKFVIFIVIGLTLPLIILALFYQLFMTFFFPTSLTKLNGKLRLWARTKLDTYARYRHDKEVEKRRKEFMNNRGYEEDSELVEIEVWEDEDVEVEESNTNNKNEIK